MLQILSPNSEARPWLVVASVTGATVLPTYISGALTVALPTLGSQIGLSTSQLQWPLTVLALVNGAFLLLSGGLADAFGRRHLFLAGAIWMMIFSIPLCVIKNAPGFIGMSAVLGLGAAMLSPAATGILSESLPDGSFKNGAFAALGAGQPTGFIFGLIIGGIFAKQQYAIYAIAAGTAGLLTIIAFLTLPEDGEKLQVKGSRLLTQEEKNARVPRAAGSLLAFDWAGAVLSTVGVVLLTLGLAFAGSNASGWRSIPVLVCLPLSVFMIATFFIWESHKQRQSSSYEEGQFQRPLVAPLIPTSVWTVPRFSPTLAVVFFAWASFNALSYFCTLIYQEIQKTSPIETSIRFLPMVGSGIALNIAGGILVARVNALWIFLAGCIGGAASAALLAVLDPAWAYYKGLLWVMITAVSPDIFFSAAQLIACQSVGPRRAALAGSLFNITVRLATSTGLALTNSIATTVTNHYSGDKNSTQALLQGYKAACWFCFASSTLAAVLATVYLRDVGIVAKKEEEATNDRSGTQSPTTVDDLGSIDLQVFRRGQEAGWTSDKGA